MTTAYARVSTDKQDERSQKEIVYAYAAKTGLKVDGFVAEVISSRTARSERKLAGVLDSLKPGDTLLVSEPSRLARGGMVELAAVVDAVKQRKARLVIVNGANGKPLLFEAGKNADLQSEMALAVIGWAANMERQNISERTKAALSARKAEGVRLGRPTGTRLTEAEAATVRKYLSEGYPKTIIARLAGITRGRLLRYLSGEGLAKKGR